MSGFPFRQILPSGFDAGVLLREGYQFTGGSIGASNSAGALSIGSVLGGVAPPVGSNLWVESITLTSMLDITVWVQKANGNLIANSAASSMYPVSCGPVAGPAIIPINGFLMEGESISFVLRTAVPSGAGTDTLLFRGGLNGRRMVNDLSYEAPKTMLVIGDSITNTTGPDYGFDFYHANLCRQLKSLGKHYRRIVKGDGGWKTSHAVIAMKRNIFSVADPDLIILMLGTNETLLADYQSNIPILVGWMNQVYPKAKICLIGPPPRQDSLETILLVPLRAWTESYITGLSNSNLHYTSLANSFDRTDANNYVSSDGAAGTRVHPTGAAHGLMAQTLISEWESGGFLGAL